VVLPTITSPLLLLVLCLGLTVLIARSMWRRLSHAGAVLLSLAIFLTSAFLAIAVSIPASFYVPQAVAVIRVSETLRGTPHRVVPVFFGTAFVCDSSGISRSGEYLIFLRGRWPFHELSWFDWSIWTRHEATVQTLRREWLHAPPLELSIFRQAVNAKQVEETELGR
jgi:hypothetical protein